MENSLNYFREYFVDFLKDNHPDYVQKNMKDLDEIVSQKAKVAFSAFNSMREDGADVQQSLEAAREILKEGMKFSRYDMVYDIVEEKFTKVFERWLKAGVLQDNCIKIVEDCEDIFKLFDTSDEFVFNDKLENDIFERIKSLNYVV